MTTINCPECKKGVFNKEVACKHCGSSIQETPNGTSEKTAEFLLSQKESDLYEEARSGAIKNIKNWYSSEKNHLTKKWKSVAIVGWLAVLLGSLMVLGIRDNEIYWYSEDDFMLWLVLGLLVFGIITVIVSIIGVWYSRRRKR